MPNKYETLLLFSPDLTTEERQKVLDDLSQVVQRYSGEVFTVDDWGLKDLAYPVQKHSKGHYLRLEYAAPGNTVHELERRIRIAEGLLKFLTVKLQDSVQTTAQEAS
ncbi:MAG: 30S ribosomal protein S6 [Desulfohalobiaceae bacterium]